MDHYQATLAGLRQQPRTWLVTGVAGFIGSHLLECLTSCGQRVIGVDNFSTGHPKNIDEALERGGIDARFRLIYGDLRDIDVCREACAGVDVVLHQAALGSVQGSIADPLSFHANNVDGFANILVAARDAGVRRFVFASSSAAYGDDTGSPKREERVGAPISPYAAHKLTNELYAATFQRVYGQQTVGLRYFNVYGPRQDPQGAYAAVIPRWISALAADERCVIYGDGETTRDFIHVNDVVQANLLAGVTDDKSASGQIYNVASGVPTSLNQLYIAARTAVTQRLGNNPPGASYADFREGDIRHSHADITRIRQRLGFARTVTLPEGLRESLGWYLAVDTPPRGSKRVESEHSAARPLTISRPGSGQDI